MIFVSNKSSTHHVASGMVKRHDDPRCIPDKSQFQWIRLDFLLKRGNLEVKLGHRLDWFLKCPNLFLASPYVSIQSIFAYYRPCSTELISLVASVRQSICITTTCYHWPFIATLHVLIVNEIKSCQCKKSKPRLIVINQQKAVKTSK